eukprot:PLAT3614.4.p1 GENE.PLAT3614.4~~PLAT3614.4.p1  ORF type:complete len:422 (-),score=67.04 PLAT3614.4:153-1418(-)
MLFREQRKADARLGPEAAAVVHSLREELATRSGELQAAQTYNDDLQLQLQQSESKRLEERKEHERMATSLVADIAFLKMQLLRVGLEPATVAGEDDLYRASRGLPMESEEMLRIYQLAQAADIIRLWRSLVVEGKKRRKDWILRHSFLWRERARETIAKIRHERRADDELRDFLRQQKASGMPLTLRQENFIKVIDHREGRLYNCPVCMDDCTIEEIVFIEGCLHCFCLGCMQGFVTVQLGEGKARRMECPQSGCSHKLSFDEVRLVLREAPEQFERYQRLLLEGHLDSDESVVRCPRPRCQTPMIRESRLPMCRCPVPSCGFHFCADCKTEWHADVTCEDYQKWLEENGAAEDRFRLWRERNTKPCPTEVGGCGSPIEKNGGCNHMTCTKCTFQFCWLCGCKYKAGHYNEPGPCHGKQFS